MIIAWRVLFTLMLGRTCPDLDCEVIFERQEWQAAYIVVKRCSPPQKPPRLSRLRDSSLSKLLIFVVGSFYFEKIL